MNAGRRDELLACVKELLPLAKIGVKHLNDQMCGSLYPAINNRAIETAERLAQSPDPGAAGDEPQERKELRRDLTKVFLLYVFVKGQSVFHYAAGNYRTAWNWMCHTVGPGKFSTDRQRDGTVMSGVNPAGQTCCVTEAYVHTDGPPEGDPGAAGDEP